MGANQMRDTVIPAETRISQLIKEIGGIPRYLTRGGKYKK